MASRATNLSITSIGVAALAVVGAALWFGTGASMNAPPTPRSPVRETPPHADDSIQIHISGAVARPGVVVSKADSRVADIVRAAGGATVDARLDLLNLAAPVRDGDHIKVPSTADQALLPSERFDLNTATAESFEQLPGVGPVLATRIVAHREASGPFETLEDLLDVPGIGEAKLAAIRAALAES